MVVERIFVCPERGGEQLERESVAVEARKGIAGDRNFGKDQYPGQNITLVEAEEIESYFDEIGRPVDLSATRRNVVTRGIRLNRLVGQRLRIGSVVLQGVELCEPCSVLGHNLASDSLPTAKVVKRWAGRGGLRADVLATGEIQRGSPIEVIDA